MNSCYFKELLVSFEFVRVVTAMSKLLVQIYSSNCMKVSRYIERGFTTQYNKLTFIKA